jgi:hypothetical protein
VMESVTTFLEQNLGLPVNRDKSQVALVKDVEFLGGCPRIMTADCEGLGQVDRFCSQSAIDCVEAARDRLSEGPDLSKTPFHPSHSPSLSA